MDSDRPPVTYNRDHGGGSKTLLRVGAVIALALVAGFIAWIVIDRSGDDSATTTTTTTPSTTGPAATKNPVGPVAVSQKGLSTLVAKLGHPVYWSGPISGDTYELTETSSGNTYVRYLPTGVKAGDKRSTFLIIATYPFPKAYAALKKVAGGKAVKIKGGGIAVVAAGYPKSVHVAYPGVPYQIEVYDPSPRISLKTATSGDVQPVP
jgi:hypothetical protein